MTTSADHLSAVPAVAADEPASVPIDGGPSLLIDGRWVHSSDGGLRQCLDPAHGSVVATVDEATPADATRAVAAARRAFDTGPWPTTPVGERVALLHRIADLLARTAGGGLSDRPRIAVIDALTGTLLALTDAPALTRAARSGTGLGPPPATDNYRPGAALDRFLRARDRRCRFPGCRQHVPRRGHLDHDTPWPAGPTSADNLTGYCTRHHRGKHQAPGWTHHLHPDARLTLTTPTGLTTTTHPPPWPGHHGTSPATAATGTADDRHDDPAPF